MLRVNTKKIRINPYYYPGMGVSVDVASVSEIISAVTEATGIGYDKILSQSRLVDIKEARHLLNYFLKKKTSLTFAAIGKITNKHHSSVIHSVKRVESMKDFDIYFKSNIPRINTLINIV